MPDNFTRLPPEDQERILAACIAEFARHGFTQASTNAIIKQAGIPKGTLFYFFGSKKDLYLYVIDQAITRYTAMSKEFASDPPGDLFERLLYYGQVRMQFALREPLLYQLFFNAFINTPAEIRAELLNRYGDYTSASMQMIFHNLDRSPFRAGVPVEKVVEMVFLMLEGIYSRYQTQWQQMEPEQSLESIARLTAEVREYFEMLKKGVYSPGGPRQNAAGRE
jgi:TetR/AcrR family transcriptional regulator